ncbi:MAG: hypothetical protein EOP47_30050 [Sphingobacteriaceae bacterium]|nr:MAG: hypothetical protein EOP47_30050 [Sphingobacteriaceae bacterium]
MYHPFSVAETLRSAWDILKKNFATIIVYSIVSLVAVFLSGFVIYHFLEDAWLAAGGVFLLLVIISYNFLAFIKLTFRLMDKEYYEFELADVIPKFKSVGSYLVLLLIVSTLTVFISNGIKNLEEGMTQNVLGIATGYFFQFFFIFFFPLCTCFIVDDESGPFESVIQSVKLIRGNVIKYLILFVIIEVLISVGTFTIVGVLLVIPFVNILLTVTYRKLVYSHLDVDDDIAETN